jgi:hypothetical protein
VSRTQTGASRSPKANPAGLQVELALRLRARSAEAEERVFVAIRSLPGTPEPQAKNYVRGLRAAISEAVDFVLTSIESSDLGESRPVAVSAQARRAAKAEVSLGTVLRRIAAGDHVLSDLLAEEAVGISRGTLTAARRAMGEADDALMALAAREYSEARSEMESTPIDDLFLQARGLLAGGDPVESLGGYRLDGWHVGLASEEGLTERELEQIAHSTNCGLLVVSDLDDRTWAWFGRARRFDLSDLEGPLRKLSESSWLIAIGEARQGLDGWRLSHDEATCALELPTSNRRRVVRARSVLLSVAILRDPVATRSLLASYIDPLDEAPERAGGELRQTLRAYLEAGQNTTTAAASLRVNRHTVQRRIRIAEELLGQRIEDCHAELGVALQLDADPDLHGGAGAAMGSATDLGLTAAAGWTDRGGSPR